MRTPYDGTYPITQWFGENENYYKVYTYLQPDGSLLPLKGHNGLDIGMGWGTRTVSPDNGTITERVEDDPTLGKYVKVHGAEYDHVLAHLSEINVVLGQVVKEGDLIGLSGNSGKVITNNPNSEHPGSHLHWGVIKLPRDKTNGFGGYIDQSAIVGLKRPDQVVVSPEVVQSGKPADNPAYVDQVIEDREDLMKQVGELKTKAEADLLAVDSVIKQKNDEIEDLRKQLNQVHDTIDPKYQFVADVQALGFDNANDLRVMRDAYLGMVAIGYDGAEAIQNKIKELEKVNVGISTQLTQVLDRNTKLAQMVADKESEDFTAIEQGIKAAKELGQLKDNVVEIKKAAGVHDPENTFMALMNLVTKIREFRITAKQVTDQAQKEVKAADPVAAEKMNSWLKYFGLATTN